MTENQIYYAAVYNRISQDARRLGISDEDMDFLKHFCRLMDATEREPFLAPGVLESGEGWGNRDFSGRNRTP